MKFIFYGVDGAAGKVRLSQLRAEKVQCRLVHAAACREAEECDSIEFMPDVSDYDRDRLNKIFDMVGEGIAKPKAETADRNPLGLTVGKGPGGRWYVKAGKTIHSGPFANESEAKAALDKEQAC